MACLVPYDEIFEIDSNRIFKDKPPGCISYDSKKKRYRVQGPGPTKKHIGFYDTREVALEALNVFDNSPVPQPTSNTSTVSSAGGIRSIMAC